MVYIEPRMSITLLWDDDMILTSLTDVGGITDENFPTPGLGEDKGEGGINPWPFG